MLDLKLWHKLLKKITPIKKMTTSLSERIANKQKQKSESKRSRYKAEFIAQQKDIADALRAGWSVTKIFETLNEEGKISCGYDTFRRYVITLLGQSEHKRTKDGKSQQKKPEHEIDGFSFNAVPKNLEDLM